MLGLFHGRGLWVTLTRRWAFGVWDEQGLWALHVGPVIVEVDHQRPHLRSWAR